MLFHRGTNLVKKSINKGGGMLTWFKSLLYLSWSILKYVKWKINAHFVVGSESFLDAASTIYYAAPSKFLCFFIVLFIYYINTVRTLNNRKYVNSCPITSMDQNEKWNRDGNLNWGLILLGKESYLQNMVVMRTIREKFREET